MYIWKRFKPLISSVANSSNLATDACWLVMGPLGPPMGLFGTIMAAFGANVGSSGTSLGPFGASLGPSGSIMGPFLNIEFLPITAKDV